jgi:hypothetical protein
MAGSMTTLTVHKKRAIAAWSHRPRRPWLFPLLPAGLNLAGITAVAGAQLALRVAGRNPFPFETRFAVLLASLTILPLLGSVVAARERRYGPAAVLTGLAAPASLVAAFVAFGWAIWALYAQGCCMNLTAVPVALFLAAALFLLAAVVSIITGQACLEALKRQSADG